MKKTILIILSTIFVIWLTNNDKKRLDEDLNYIIEPKHGNLDTIYQSKPTDAPWHKFTKEQIINNEYPKRKKY